jgi:hypothetical protein
MKRSALTTLVGLALAASTLAGTACSDGTTTDTQKAHLEKVKAALYVTPSPVDFGEVPMGDTKDVKVYLKIDMIGNDEYLQFSDVTQSGGLVKVSFPTEGADCEDGTGLGRYYFSCSAIFTLDLTKATARSSGSGTIRLQADLVKNPTFLGSFYVDVPYTWGTPTGTTTTIATTVAPTTAAPTTAAPTTAAPTTVAATTPAGQPSISVSPSGYNFGSVPYSSAAHNFVVTNTGSGTLSFTSFRYAVGGQFFYTIGNSCQGASLRAGQSCTVSIQVSSGGPDISPPPGSHADTMNIVSNGGNASISLSYTTPG